MPVSLTGTEAALERERVVGREERIYDGHERCSEAFPRRFSVIIKHSHTHRHKRKEIEGKKKEKQSVKDVVGHHFPRVASSNVRIVVGIDFPSHKKKEEKLK